MLIDFDIKIVLKEGVSINNKFLSRNFILTKKYRDWISYARKKLNELGLNKPFKSECEVYIEWFRSRKIGDVDGRIKPILDALEGFVYLNDKQVKRVSCERFEDKIIPRYEIYIKIIK